jgi:poly(A) polymerase
VTEKAKEACPAWMRTSATGAVMAALQDAGGPQSARFVGGCVRNTVLNCRVDDIDIATMLTPDQVMQALADADIKCAHRRGARHSDGRLRGSAIRDHHAAP